MPKLVVRQGSTSRDIPLARESFSIGRTPENDLEVKDSLISRRHSSIVKKGEQYVVYDLGSSNGTFVNRERIEMKTLNHGDVIRVGETEIAFFEDGNSSTQRTPRIKPETRVPPPQGQVPHDLVQHVEDIAQSYGFDISEALSRGLSLRDMRREVGGEKAAKDSKMFFILFQVGKALSTAATLDEMLATATKLIFEVINAERCLFLLRPPGGGDVAARLCYHRARGVTDAKDIHISRTITTQVMSDKVAIITSDALQDPRFAAGLSIVQYNIRSALCVPLWEQQEVFGVIYLDNLAKTYAFTKEDLELLTAIANLVAIRIKQEETTARLRHEELLRSNLTKFYSPEVVNMIMARGGEVGLEVAEREVSVVFIDVEASTHLAETKPAVEVVGLLNEFFLMATEAVFAYKGHVNKFIGDEVMAIFNAPVDMPNHAVSAVRCCTLMLQKLEKWYKDHPDKKFNVRCAVNTGVSVAGNVGTPTRMEYTVLGDAVNVAARLSKVPQVNSVVVGERTWEIVKAHFKGKDLGEIMLRGKEKPLRAYQIIP